MDRFVNCHTHVFNVKCAPDRFIGLPVARMISQRKLLVKGAVKLMRLIGSSEEAALEKWASFLDIGSQKSQADVFDMLRRNYSFGPMAYVALTLDMDHMGAGTAQQNFVTQLAEVRRLKLSYLDELVPFISVDPRAGSPEKLLDVVRRHLERHGFGGIKLYPSLGFYPFDPRLEPLYAYAQEHRVPVLTHCSRGGIFYQGDTITLDQLRPMTFGFQPAVRIHLDGSRDDAPMDFSDSLRRTRRFLGKTWGKGKRNEHFKHHFTDPLNYLLVLERFPELKLCLAHFGGDASILNYVRGVNTDDEPLADNWHAKVIGIMKKYPNVYTDISYALWQDKIAHRLRDCISGAAPDAQGIADRILFGTDYFMTIQEKTEVRLVQDFRAVLSPEHFRRIAVDNPRRFLETRIPYAMSEHFPV